MSDYRVLVTGSRDWLDHNTVGAALACILAQQIDAGRSMTVVHGDCPTGADRLASIWVGHMQIWLGRGPIAEEPYPADWNRYGNYAGPKRNEEMVKLGAAVCLAFPMPRSKGTRNCIRLAEAAGIPVREFKPGGGTC